MIQPDSNGLYHPTNEDDIIGLIQYAIQNKLEVRVRGAAQSVINAVYTDGYSTASVTATKNINIELDQLRDVTVDEANMQVTVGGGCNLGYDPFDPSGVSAQSDSNNLFFQLNQKGLAIPNVSDAIHQTVAGYISTGCSAGSIQHSFDECILAIRMIDGNGQIKTFTKSDNLDDAFYGVVVSMGLLGIITQVTLKCIPAFNITGKESITPVTDCEYDFFGPGSQSKLSLQQFLSTTEFTRTMWWPYSTLQRAVVWQARTMTSADYNAQTGIPPNFVPKPYRSIFPSVLGSTLLSEAFAATGFSLIATWPSWFYKFLGVSETEGDKDASSAALKTLIEKLFPTVYPMLIDMFFKCNSPSNPAQLFWDYWLSSLPMDKAEFSNNLFNLAYTEMWIPVEQAANVVNDMQDYYTKVGYAATGFFTTEIFGAKSSNFWLSPAYQQSMVRINLLWFGQNLVDPTAYFQQFWTLLSKYNFRPHWGKCLPAADSAQGTSYLQSNYPKWNEWMQLREQMDPHQIFVTSYWRSNLGIPSAN